MKLIWSLLALVCSSGLLFGLGPGEMPEGFRDLEIGDEAPGFELPGTDGEAYSLEDFAEPEVLMVLFTGTHCPTSHGIEDRLQELIEEMKEESFGIVAINPNHSSGLRPDEFSYTLYDESFEGSKGYAEELGWEFPFLYDGDEQLIARAYGCRATPHVFIFDKERKLRYNGRYDDSRFKDPSTVKSPDARNAIEALLAGKAVPVEKTRSHGCSTKWKGRSEHVEEDESQWQGAEAVVEEIDAEGVAKLAANGSGKLRLFNVWATWCEPCVAEMPDLSAIARKFSRREFELITISLDAPEDKDKAAAFLGKQQVVMGDKVRKSVEAEGRTTNNYLFSEADTDALAEALDPEWPGPVPYSVLIDSDGEVVERYSTVIDPVEVNTVILETLKTYYEPKK